MYGHGDAHTSTSATGGAADTLHTRARRTLEGSPPSPAYVGTTHSFTTNSHTYVYMISQAKVQANLAGESITFQCVFVSDSRP